MAKQTVRNVSGGPRVLNAKPAVMLQPGETVEVDDIDEAELDMAKLSDWFEFGAKAKAKAEPESEAAK